MEKSGFCLSTYVEYVEDFRFWMNVVGRTHRLPDKEIAKCFVSGLKPNYFVKKCIRGLSIPWRMSFVKAEKIYLLIAIY